MKKMSDSEKLYKTLDKVLGYSLPKNIVKLNIELEVDNPPLITVSYYPDNILGEDSPLVNEQFNVVPAIVRKRKGAARDNS
jgi:hypothetical protein